MNKSTKILHKIAETLGMKEFNLEETEGIELIETSLEDGTIFYSEAELDLGIQLFTDIEMTTLVEDGTYVTANGTTFEIIDTVVGTITEPETEAETPDETEVEAKEETPEETPEETETETEVTLVDTELVDGTILYSEEGIIEGTILYTDPEMTIVVEDGEYTTANGELVTIADGKIETIGFVVEEELKSENKNLKEENVDLKSQIEELEKKVEHLNKVELALKEKLDKTPASASITLGEDVKETKTNLKSTNREYTRFVLNQIKK